MTHTMDAASGYKSCNYREFMQYVDHLVATGKTSGLKQSPALTQFTALNLKRMHRIDKTFALNDSIQQAVRQLEIPQRWVFITEAWCGDSAQILPVIHKMTEVNRDRITLSIILRDQHPEWIERYHTEGSRAIPKLVAFDYCGKELFTWGPRPAPAQDLLRAWKKDASGRTRDDFERELHTWYARDKSRTLQEEFTQILYSLDRICKPVDRAA